MISPGHGWGERLGEDSDPEDGLSSEHDGHGAVHAMNRGIRRPVSHVSSAASGLTHASASAQASRQIQDNTRMHNSEIAGIGMSGNGGRADPQAAPLPQPPLTHPVLTHEDNLSHLGNASRFARRTSHMRVLSRFETSDAGEEARALVEKDKKLQGEAPIRGLARQMSRFDIKAAAKKPATSGHKQGNESLGNSILSAWMNPSSVHSRKHSGAKDVLPTTATTTTAPGGAANTTGDIVLMNAGPISLAGGADGVVPPPVETPPPVRALPRRASLVKEQAEEQPETIEQELMIGEIKNIELHEEIAIVRRALVVIALVFIVVFILREFFGRLSHDVNVLRVVGFVSTILLSFPVLRFTARLFAYFITTKAAVLLYRGNRYYFVVALHYDIAMTTWAILTVCIWQQLFYDWVYNMTGSEKIYRYGYDIIQCHLALRVGLLVKNFVVLIVATSYLWRPYIRRVQSNILAQYILLLLVDYCTKGACNAEDQKFAMEMGRQGMDKRNISLYAVSKAMGFIPRNKLGHSFFRKLGGSDTLDSSKDAVMLANFLFSELLERSKPAPPTPSPQRSGGTSTASPENRRINMFSVRRKIESLSTQNTVKGSTPSSSKHDGDHRRGSLPDGWGGGGAKSGGGAAKRQSSSGNYQNNSTNKNNNRGAAGGGGGGTGDYHGGMSGVADAVAAGIHRLKDATERAFSGSTGRSITDDSGSNGHGNGGLDNNSQRNGSVSTVDSPGAGFSGGGGCGRMSGSIAQRSGSEAIVRVVEGDEKGAATARAEAGNGNATGAVGDDGTNYDHYHRQQQQQQQQQLVFFNAEETDLEGGGTVASAVPANGDAPTAVNDSKVLSIDESLLKMISDGSAGPGSTALGHTASRAGEDHGALATEAATVVTAATSRTPAGEAAVAAAAVAGETRQDKGMANNPADGVGKGDNTAGRAGFVGQRASALCKVDDSGEWDEACFDAKGCEEEENLNRTTLCPDMHRDLLDVAMKIFDLNGSGTVTREKMVQGVVGIFKDHRSLALTLQDSEHIARKLGLIITGVILFILFFVWLSIWGADVLSLSVTFASFLIAFSFMIGTSASNLMSSIIFIFVVRCYDVGDRVHIYADTQTAGKLPTDVSVVKVNLLTTVFKRWDEQVFYVPNHILASKTIVNIQRTAHQWHEFWINVSSSTPSSKLNALQAALQAFARLKDKPEGIYSRMGFSLTEIKDSTRLTIRITFRQRGNWQNLEKKWAIQSMCTWAIKKSCDDLGISYSFPEVPLNVKQKLP